MLADSVPGVEGVVDEGAELIAEVLGRGGPIYVVSVVELAMFGFFGLPCCSVVT